MVTGQSSMIPLDPFDQRARPNPYPVYQYMRTVEPIHKSPVGFWILTRYEDCRRVLEDDRWSHDADSILEPRRGEAAVDPTVRLLRASISFSDPPAHNQATARLEKALKKSMTGIADRTERVARDLIKLMREKGPGVDLVRDYTAPLSLVVLADLIGIAPADRSKVHRWSLQMAAGLDPSVRARGVANADAAAMAMVELLLDRFDAAGAETGGVIGHVARSRARARTWDLVADVTAMLVTGIETARGMLGNSLLALLRNPDAMAALRHDPARMSVALEELIRFDGPVHLTARVARKPVDIGSVTIPEGEQAVALIAAANRDPARFRDPDTLDLDRADNPHLGFGAGPHACFAAPLARIIGGTGIAVLLSEVDHLALDGDPEWQHTVTIRSLSKLPVRVEA